MIPVTGYSGWSVDEYGNAYENGVLVPGHAQDSGHILLGHFKYRRAILVCTAFHGPPPEHDSMACHKDDVGGNDIPSNLYWGNASSNARDAWRNGRRAACGSKASGSKLIEEQVIEIRHIYPSMSRKQLAKMYGVSGITIHHNINRVTWTHVP